MRDMKKTYGALFKEIFNKAVEAGELEYDKEKFVTESGAMKSAMRVAVTNGMIKGRRRKNAKAD